MDSQKIILMMDSMQNKCFMEDVFRDADVQSRVRYPQDGDWLDSTDRPVACIMATSPNAGRPRPHPSSCAYPLKQVSSISIFDTLKARRLPVQCVFYMYFDVQWWHLDT